MEFLPSCSHVWHYCTVSMKRVEKRLDENYIKMLHAILNKSWKQHLTKDQLYGNLLLISQIIQDKQDMLGTCDDVKHISDVFLLTSSHGNASVSRSVTMCGHWIQSRGPARNCGRYGHMSRERERERERERVMGICAIITT